MSNEKQNADSSQDELLKTKTNIELTESELSKASGGQHSIKYGGQSNEVTEESFLKWLK